MKRSEAFLCKGEKLHQDNFGLGKVDYRRPARVFYENYSNDQLSYLWEHKYIRFSNPIEECFENKKESFIEFTPKGKKWRIWYTMPRWKYIKIYILKKYWWQHKLQNLLI